MQITTEPITEVRHYAENGENKTSLRVATTNGEFLFVVLPYTTAFTPGDRLVISQYETPQRRKPGPKPGTKRLKAEPAVLAEPAPAKKVVKKVAKRRLTPRA